MRIQELGAEETHVRFSLGSCKHQEEKEWRSYLPQPKTMQQHSCLTIVTTTFTATFSTVYLARNCEALLNSFVTYSSGTFVPVDTS